MIDRAIAAVLAVLTAPVVAVLAVLVRRHDAGPSLITVPRVGRDGRTFDMWKLRSMRAATSDGRAAGAALTSSDDDRITPIGARMRSLHLDELPQLYNVVRGEMCLLGPRPEAPAYVDPSPAWTDVLRVPPGIAGPTQLVVGDWERTQIDSDRDGDAYRRVVVPVKLAIDAWYVSNASAALDLLVLSSLVRHVLPGPEHPGLLRRVSAAVPSADRTARAPLLGGSGVNTSIRSTEDGVFRLLFVCTANQCRSPMAEVIAADMLASRGVDAAVASCGVMEGGSPASAGAVRAVARRGLDLSGHVSHQLDSHTVDAADLIITMERRHIASVAELSIDAVRRTFTLPELADLAVVVGPRRPGATIATWIREADAMRIPESVMSVSTRERRR